jgi:hypothetical protein
MENTRRDGAGGRPGDGLLDDVRALAEGRLSPEEADALLRRAAANPEDAALVEAFAEVHAMTAVIDDEPPPCTVRFEDVEARIADSSRPILRPWALRAAAAVLVAAAAVGGWALTRPSVPTVRLAAVSATAVVPADPLAAAGLRAAGPLADYQPLRDGEPQWLESLDDGRAVARVTGRPVLLFIHHPTCPACLDLRGETFQDAGVQERLAGFVPVMVNVMELPEELQGFLGRGWPYLGALDAQGSEFAAFPGMSKASTFRRHLDDAAQKFGDAEPLAWGPSRALAARLRDAMAAGDAGALGREHRELSALVADDTGAFGRAAARRLEERGAEAADVLRRATAAEPAEAVTLLDDASARFAETPWARDIESVRDALRETGRVPRLEPPLDGEAQ